MTLSNWGYSSCRVVKQVQPRSPAAQWGGVMDQQAGDLISRRRPIGIVRVLRHVACRPDYWESSESSESDSVETLLQGRIQQVPRHFLTKSIPTDGEERSDSRTEEETVLDCALVPNGFRYGVEKRVSRGSRNSKSRFSSNSHTRPTRKRRGGNKKKSQ